MNMKCLYCILESLGNKDISTDKPFQEGVDDAKTAVTVHDGAAICVAHLHERYIIPVLPGRRG
jgi:hypothetical protein